MLPKRVSLTRSSRPFMLFVLIIESYNLVFASIGHFSGDFGCLFKNLMFFKSSIVFSGAF